MYSYDPPDDQDLNDPPETTPADEDIEWALLAEAVDRGGWPETEVEL